MSAMFFRKVTETVNNLEIQGMTALGPALVSSCSFVSDCPYSEVVLCTDGMANVGIGSLEGRHGNQQTVDQFYDKV